MRKTSEFRLELFPNGKNLGIPFWTIFNRKKHRVLFQIIFGKEKLRNSAPNQFSEQRTLENPFKTLFGDRKYLKKTSFVGCFVKLHYFTEFRFVPFHSELRNWLFQETRNSAEWALFTAEFFQSEILRWQPYLQQ
jgi:hypothetical protein